jgi:hypothetical protein
MTSAEGGEWAAAMLAAYGKDCRSETRYYWEKLNARCVERLPMSEILRGMAEEPVLVLLFDPNPQNRADANVIAQLFGVAEVPGVMGSRGEFSRLDGVLDGDFYLFPPTFLSLMIATHEDDVGSGARVCQRMTNL